MVQFLKPLRLTSSFYSNCHYIYGKVLNKRVFLKFNVCKRIGEKMAVVMGSVSKLEPIFTYYAIFVINAYLITKKSNTSLQYIIFKTGTLRYLNVAITK